MNRFISRILLFAFIVTLIPLTVFGAGSNNSRNPFTRRSLDSFGDQSVNRFEQMFETDKIDFNYRSDKNGGSILHYAAFRGNLERVKKLLNRGANVNVRDNDGMTPLHYAIQEGNIHVLEYLVEQRANVNARDNDGSMASHYAALYGNLEEFQWLVDHGADINAKDNYGNILLYYAIWGDNRNVVKWLVDDKKLDVDSTDVMFKAAKFGSQKILQWCIDE